MIGFHKAKVERVMPKCGQTVGRSPQQQVFRIALAALRTSPGVLQCRRRAVPQHKDRGDQMPLVERVEYERVIG